MILFTQLRYAGCERKLTKSNVWTGTIGTFSIRKPDLRIPHLGMKLAAALFHQQRFNHTTALVELVLILKSLRGCSIMKNGSMSMNESSFLSSIKKHTIYLTCYVEDMFWIIMTRFSVQLHDYDNIRAISKSSSLCE